MEQDERFKHLATDPRFRPLRKKQRKVVIDDRFKSMFTDEKFTLKYKRDKRGRNQIKTTGDDLKRYYSIRDEDEGQNETKRKGKRSREAVSEEPSERDEDKPTREPSSDRESSKDAEKGGVDLGEDEDDENENEDTDENEDEEKEEEEEDEVLSTSSDEPESDDDDLSKAGDDVAKINYDWQPLDHDAETAESTTRRLAIQNLDWDQLDAKDLYVLVNSIRPPLTVKIYVSEFGKERLKREELEGPSELIETSMGDEVEEEYDSIKAKMLALKGGQGDPAQRYKINEYEDADDALDVRNEAVRNRIRRYQLNKMKYYYAIAEFDSAETAGVVYKELDGLEYEGSSLELDLRFVPDEMEFDETDARDECAKLPDPATYKAPMFISSALQQTTVRFTWDETDVKRQEKLSRAFTKEELERDDLEAYLASDTSDSDEGSDAEGNMVWFDDQSNGGEDDEKADSHKPARKRRDCDNSSVITANSEARVNKYKALLASLEEEAERKKKVEVDIEWDNCDSEADDDDEHAREFGDESGDEEDQASDETSLRAKKRGHKSKKQRQAEKKRKFDAEESERKVTPVAGKKSKRNKKPVAGDEALDLLVMEGAGHEGAEFEFNPDDDRFKAVYESGLYNIDPSHPSFKQTPAFIKIAERKRERRTRKTRT